MKFVNSENKIANIEILRGLAALLVTIYHLSMVNGVQLTGDSMDFIRKWIMNGWIGVPLFFVISGVVISISLWNVSYRNLSRNIFAKKRILRIAPLHYLTLLISALFFTNWSSNCTYKSLIMQMLFLQNLDPHASQCAFNGPSWSIALEMQFYALAAIVIIPLMRFQAKQILCCSIAITLLWKFLLMEYWGNIPSSQGEQVGRIVSWSNMLPGVICDFAFGFLIARNLLFQGAIAEFMRKYAFKGFVLSLFLLWLYIEAMAYVNTNYYSNNNVTMLWVYIFSTIPLGAIFALLVCSACFLQNRARILNPLVYLGTISYGVYLWHWIVITLLLQFLKPGLAFNVITLIATVILASLSWHFFEKPILKLNSATSTVTRLA